MRYLLVIPILALAGILFAIFQSEVGDPIRAGTGEGDGSVRTPAPVAVSGPDSSDVRVEVAVERYGSILPAAQVPIEVRRAGVAVPADVEVVAGAGTLGGGADRGPAIVRVRVDGRTLYRRVDVDAERGATLELEPARPLRGVILSPAGKPIMNARVWCGQGEWNDEAAFVKSNATGRYVIREVVGNEGVPIVVSAPGWATTVVFPEHELTSGRDVVVRMFPGATVELQLASVLDNPDAGYVVVSPQGAVRTELLRYPFFLDAIRGFARLDGRGQSHIDGLPRGASVGLTVCHPKVHVGRPHIATLNDEKNRVVLPAQSVSGHIEGRVVDGSGAPVRGALVVGQPSGPRALIPLASRWMLPPEAKILHGPVATTGLDGEFVLSQPKGGVFEVWFAGRAILSVDLAHWRKAGAPPIVAPVDHEDPPALVLQGIDEPCHARVDRGPWRFLAPGAQLLAGPPAWADVEISVFRGKELLRRERFPAVVLDGPVAFELDGE